MMPRFDVTWMLTREQTVRVEARNAKEAKELVEAGHGKVIRGKRTRLKLLCFLGVERVPQEATDA